MRIHLKFTIVILLGSAAVLPSQVGAQQADSMHHRNNCRLARQVLSLGQPANHRTWALRYIPSCSDDAVEILTQAITRHRGAHTGNTELGVIVDALSPLVDRRVGFAAAALARDAGAGTGARLEAVRLLYWQIRPGFPVPLEEFTRQEQVVSETETSTVYQLPPPFTGSLWSDAGRFEGEPYTANEWETLAEELGRIASNTSAPADVRIAARRVHQMYVSFVRGQRLCPPGTGPVECVNRLRDNPR
jgi:hypothetical protein